MADLARAAVTLTIAHRQIPTEVFRPRIPTEVGRSVGILGAAAALVRAGGVKLQKNHQ
jgi:hypothetical protein